MQTLGTDDTTTAFTARNFPLGVDEIAADDAMTVITIHRFLCMHLIALFFLYKYLSSKTDVVLFIRGGFFLL